MPGLFFPSNYLVLTLLAVGPVLSGGHGWVRRGSAAECVQRFVADPSNPSVVYGHSYGDRVYRSGDGGSNWISLPGPAPFLASLLVSPINSSTLFAVAQGFYVSRDSGVSWERSVTAPPYLNGPMIQDPHEAATMYVATSCCIGGGHYFPEVWVTTDAGERWSLRAEGLFQGSDSEFILSLIAHPRERGVLLASLTTGVYRTEDQGRNWIRLAETDVGVLAGFDSESDLVWAMKSGTVLRSVDGGRSWATVELPSYPTVESDVINLVPDPTRPHTAHAAVDTEFAGSFFGSTVERTWDAGDNWMIAPGLPTEFDGWVRGLSASSDGSIWVSVCGESNDIYRLGYRDTRSLDPR